MTVPPDLKKRNRRTLLAAGVTVVAMVGAAYGFVPLYSLFCKITGLDGTTQRAAVAPPPAEIRERVVTVRFNADTDRGLAWDFRPLQKEVAVRVGQQGLAGYEARNIAATPLAGSAVYNVTPFKAAKYFKKVQCFCFQEQALGPGERVNMPVMFFIEPAFAEDREMEDVGTITLSYTFYKIDSAALEQAMEAFYNQPAAKRPSPTN